MKRLSVSVFVVSVVIRFGLRYSSRQEQHGLVDTSRHAELGALPLGGVLLKLINVNISRSLSPERR